MLFYPACPHIHLLLKQYWVESYWTFPSKSIYLEGWIVIEDWIYGSDALKTTFMYTVAKTVIEWKYTYPYYSPNTVVKAESDGLNFFSFLFLFLFSFPFYIFGTRVRVKVTRSCGHKSHNS